MLELKLASLLTNKLFEISKFCVWILLNIALSIKALVAFKSWFTEISFTLIFMALKSPLILTKCNCPWVPILQFLLGFKSSK